MSRFKVMPFLIKAKRCSTLNEVSRKCLVTVDNHVNYIQYRLCTNVADKEDNYTGKISILDPCKPLDLSEYGSVPPPSHNLAAYANKSQVLQELIKLGVELYKLDKKPEVGEFLLRLDFEKHIKPYLIFLHDKGVSEENLGRFLTVNPLIFKENLSDLEVRINYLESKKFDQNMIAQIITKNPAWLSIPVKNIDKRLGYLQQTLQLKGDQVRKIITEDPGLVTVKTKRLMINVYTLKEEMGLDIHSLKKLVVNTPDVLRRDEYELMLTYEYLTKTMKIPQCLILKQPKILRYSKFKINERHKYLEVLGRAQYNPLLPGYVSLMDLVVESDKEFCDRIAKTTILTFNEFLKTL